MLVDQHAAHERLTHEALNAQLVEGGVRAQPLLLPAVVDLPAADALRLVDHAETLARLGLEIEGFGGGAVLVRALPALLGNPDPAPLLRDLAEELADLGEAASLQRRLDAAVARLACHGSVRAGRRLNAAEMDALLRADGSHAARGDLQPWPAHRAAAGRGGAGAHVRPALIRCWCAASRIPRRAGPGHQPIVPGACCLLRSQGTRRTSAAAAWSGGRSPGLPASTQGSWPCEHPYPNR